MREIGLSRKMAQHGGQSGEGAGAVGGIVGEDVEAKVGIARRIAIGAEGDGRHLRLEPGDDMVDQASPAEFERGLVSASHTSAFTAGQYGARNLHRGAPSSSSRSCASAAASLSTWRT